MKNVLHINTVSDYLNLRKQEVLHPLIGIVDFNRVIEKGYENQNYNAFHYSCYAIFLKDTEGCKMMSGGKPYDYDEGTLVFMAPNQIIEFGNIGPDYVPKGYALVFHPDLLLGTGLLEKIHKYSFFSYSSNEALHLSSKERKIILSLIEKIQFELEQNIDNHSKNLITANLVLLLDYCTRFYDRQFITREDANKTLLEKFDLLLINYFLSEKPKNDGLPSVSYFAEQLHLSSNYFGDLVKKETGKSPQEHIHLKVINLAKERIYNADKSISEIAYELGFKYPQHFSRMFKKSTGVAPNEFRNLN